MKAKQSSAECKEVDLGEIFEVKRGSTITKNLVTVGTVPVIAGGQGPAYYHNESNRVGETITVSGSGAYAGFVNYFDIPIFASDCSTIQAKDDCEVSARYGFYFLKSYQKIIYNLQRGIAQPHVYPSDLAKIKIPLPPLSVQKKIVEILERAEGLKRRREEADGLMDDYLKSVFSEMFFGKGFESDLLGNICDVRDGTHDSPSYSNEGYPLITSKNLTNGFIDFSKVNLISEEDFDKINKRSKVDLGDIIMPMIGTIGNPIIVKEKNPFAIKNVALIKFTKTNISNIYIMALLNSDYFKKLIGSCNRGGTQKFIALKDIRGFKIPLPPIVLQEKFVSIVEGVEKIKEAQGKSGKEIDDLFGVLMQKAFRGEIGK